SPPQDVIQGLSLSLAKVTKALADATGSLPTYDQKQFEGQLKSFEKSIEQLRASTTTKSKFAFKRKPQSSVTSIPTPPSAKKPFEPRTLTPSTPSTSSQVLLSSHSHKYLTRSDLPEHSEQPDLSISDLDSCIVNLLPANSKDKDDSSSKDLVLSALHARNLTHCVILLPLITGSALLHDLIQCTIVLGSHQFRMHSSKKTDVFLHIFSNPIIEDCSGIRFTQYPTYFLPSSAAQKEQPPLSVQDFSHIRPTPSPNFSIMSDTEKV
ncbi:tubulin binding cofactor C-domain-containing protein, partial [Gymnopilus junonius]